MGWLSVSTAVIAILRLARAHTIITYPGWRGDNLITNGTAPDQNAGTIGVDYNGFTNSYDFPYGMQFLFPCGGLPQSANRTRWPYQGGALSIQPGWGDGHKNAQIYINIGVTENMTVAPANYSYNVIPGFAITGPNNSDYGGSQICLPQVPMPAGLSLTIGDNVTIQVVEHTQSGAALYSCVDVTLTDPSQVEEVTPQNCYNSTDIQFELLFTSAALSSGAVHTVTASGTLVLTIALAVTAGLYTLL